MLHDNVTHSIRAAQTLEGLLVTVESFLNQEVVVDVESLFVYAGILSEINDKTIALRKADVHDLRDSETTRERYVLDTRLHGVRANRDLVYISRSQIVSLSLVADILT